MAPRSSKAWRCTTTSAPCCWRCKSRRARTPSRWLTAFMPPWPSCASNCRPVCACKPLAAVAELRQQLPPGVRLQTIGDSARPIRVAVNNVRQTLIEGALLTVLIVFLFLNSWRSTVITGLPLPIALIGTFLCMNLFGFTINMITLMALSLCVGLLIDDAIVVRENIVRDVQMGQRAYDPRLEGTREIVLAVLATTLSIVAVFLPIGFMGGIIGKFFHEFG